MSTEAGTEAGTACAFYIDMPLGRTVMDGDWIATAAGSRYLVTSARKGTTKNHSQQTRWHLTLIRLQKNCPIPDDVHCIELRWYSRG